MTKTAQKNAASFSLWGHLRKELERILDPDEFATWFWPLTIRAGGDTRLILMAPNARFLHTLEKSYRPYIDQALAALDEPSAEVELGLLDEEESQIASEEPQPVQCVGLDPCLIFDNFVVGEANLFPHAAAKAVAENPGERHNPLFLYGPGGLGKTHLLHAIGNLVHRTRPELRVIYMPAETFVNEAVNAMRFDHMPAFREHINTTDVLLVDDINFLVGKERCLEEFTHRLDGLLRDRKQVVLAGPAHPRHIAGLPARLASMMQGGLPVDIHLPDIGTCEAIARRKATDAGIVMPDEVLHFVVRQHRSSVRELEGMLNRLLAFSELTGRRLTLEVAHEQLGAILTAESSVSTGYIIKVVAKNYGLTDKEIRSRSNTRRIAFPRQVAMYLCKQLTDLSYPEVGKLFNNKHHSTVMYGVSKIEEMLAQKEVFPGECSEIERLHDQFAPVATVTPMAPQRRRRPPRRAPGRGTSFTSLADAVGGALPKKAG